MKVTVVLLPSEEGYAVSAPSLPGCWSQGATREEALANIADAVREYLEGEVEQPTGARGSGGRGGCLAVGELPDVNHLQAVPALEKASFRILRQGKHIVMTDGVRRITIPRHNPVNAVIMAGIVKDAGLTIDEFRKLL
jgi:predicted RNase H-like HicB family nuclease